MMKGRPLYIPTNKETKERLIKNRRAQLIAPVTRPQRAQEKKRVPPFLTTDPIMHKVYEHEHEYIHYPIVGAKSKAELVGPDDRKINRGDVTADYFTISVIIHKVRRGGVPFGLQLDPPCFRGLKRGFPF